jgi:hypothetical protein
MKSVTFPAQWGCKMRWRRGEMKETGICAKNGQSVSGDPIFLVRIKEITDKLSL